MKNRYYTYKEGKDGRGYREIIEMEIPEPLYKHDAKKALNRNLLKAVEEYKDGELNESQKVYIHECTINIISHVERRIRTDYDYVYEALIRVTQETKENKSLSQKQHDVVFIMQRVNISWDKTAQIMRKVYRYWYDDEFSVEDKAKGIISDWKEILSEKEYEEMIKILPIIF